MQAQDLTLTTGSSVVKKSERLFVTGHLPRMFLYWQSLINS